MFSLFLFMNLCLLQASLAVGHALPAAPSSNNINYNDINTYGKYKVSERSTRQYHANNNDGRYHPETYSSGIWQLHYN